MLDRWPLPAVLAAYARARDWRRAEAARELGRTATLLQGQALIHGFDERGRRRAEQFEELLTGLGERAAALLAPEAPAEAEQTAALSPEQARFLAAARPESE